MAHSIARPSICGLQAALASCRISTTTTKIPVCSTSPWRAFSTTPIAAVPVPPESPKYITIPEPPQSAEVELPPIKGHLPVPRDPFPKREGNRKVTPEYIAATTRVSKAELAGEEPRSEKGAHQRLMAAARREAFASGIQGLYVRKSQREIRLHARSEARRKANKAAATAPERLDDMLTRSTVLAATALDTAVPLDPNRFEKAKAARVQHQQKMDAKAEARRDSLAQLYVAAQAFITTEAELEQRIESIFTEDHHKYNGTDFRSESIWDARGIPPSVADMRADMFGMMGKVATEVNNKPMLQTTKRQKELAEELTGGKL